MSVFRCDGYYQEAMHGFLCLGGNFLHGFIGDTLKRILISLIINIVNYLGEVRSFMLISERIYKYLEERGMSQIEFSKRTGISQSTISDWRRKGTNPSADKIMKICEVLDVSPTELLTGVGSELQMKDEKCDYVVVDKASEEYLLVEVYRQLDADARKRLEGYMVALKDIN